MATFFPACHWCWNDPVALSCKWLLRDRITNPADPGRTNKSHGASRYSAKGHHILDVTARRRLISVTESIALPPRPKAVNMSNINKFSIREWLVPPILLPIFLVLLVVAAMLVQW